MRSVLAFLALLFVTPYYVARFLLVELTGVGDRDGRLTLRAPRVWGKSICAVSGVRVVGHGIERLRGATSRVIIANHVSWFDVFSLAAILPEAGFIAKAEIGRISIFGRAMRTAGMLFVDRENHKAAFANYEEAAIRIKKGRTVVIFPEGTRGKDYALRPFKKGPFVLAISAGVPIVPVLVHGTREVLPRDSLRVRKNTVHVHVLDEVSTAGCTYADRNRLAQEVRNAIAAAQKELYGIESPPWTPGRVSSGTPAAT